MTIRHLKTFIKVCETNNISKAAEELCITQPSVSQTIKELEKYYNAVLFDRVGKKLSLTKDGLILLAKAKEVCASFDEFENIANKTDASPKVRIGATMTFGTFTLPSLVTEMEQLLPGLDPYFYIDKVQGLEEKILAGDLDFAILECHPSSKLVKSTYFGTDALIAVAGPNYQIPDKIKLEDIIKYDLLVRETGSAPRKVLDEVLLKKGIRITNPRMESISNMIIIAMAMNDKGIALLPYLIVKRYLDEGKLREIKLDVTLERQLCLIHHKNKHFTSMQKKAYSLLQRILKESSF